MHRVGDVALRKLEPKDIDALFVIKNDPELAGMLGGFNNGYTRTDLQNWLEFHRTAKDEVLWAIADSEKDSCLGHVGLYKIDHRIGSAEFAILLGDRSRWGKGLGTACTAFAVEYAFTSLNLRRVYLEVLATNPRAVAVYKKLGFKEEGRLREHQYKNGAHVDVLVMGLLRSEWRRAT
jgi:[ribosomal protein S5]-alanine N-acetyltransferase